MMVTALSPVIGYDKAARIAHRALDEDLTLKDAALKSGVSQDLYDKVIDPERLTRPDVATPGSTTASTHDA
jgi:fumarate hydratase class II